ncbi:MAG: deoxyribodipyrimidine photo-lyase, partial [Cytophagaceae bacterium]|nr:deoxyribodipyrimidine photo-lyase [Gemmatimonadaceae bacterium]
MQPLESQYVRDQVSRRGVRLNEKRTNPEGRYVLYWMQSTHRLHENWALRFAILQADRLNKPLLIHQGLDPTYEHANDRIHSFILHNARELTARAAELGLTYRFVLRHRRDDDRRVVDQLAADAAMVVTDLYPTAGIAERSRRFAERAPCRIVAVESFAIIPSGIFEKEEYAARTIRPKLLPLLPHALQEVEDRPQRVPFPDAWLAGLAGTPLDLARCDIGSEVARCEIDHAVRPVDMVSGYTAARSRLNAFCADALATYGKRRADPNDEVGSSRLSPYLHFGQIPAAEVARAALASGHGAQADAFIGELVVWRELALNFCLRNPRYATLDALPAWVHKTMGEHAADPRDATYSLAEFEGAATHEPLWNAAQREIVASGLMHNVVRMLWGKHVIQWAPTYGDALRWLVHLNNKYGLDGRDPCSFAGIQWCFGKFDRPFYTRPVLGVIRTMSLKRAR